MFTLIKLLLELLFAIAIFFSGVMFSQKFPTVAAKFAAMVSALFTSTPKPPSA